MTLQAQRSVFFVGTLESCAAVRSLRQLCLLVGRQLLDLRDAPDERREHNNDQSVVAVIAIDLGDDGRQAEQGNCVAQADDDQADDHAADSLALDGLREAVALEALDHGVDERDGRGHERAEQQDGVHDEQPGVAAAHEGDDALVGELHDIADMAGGNAGNRINTGALDGGQDRVPAQQHGAGSGERAAVHEPAEDAGALDALVGQLGGSSDHGRDGHALESSVHEHAAPDALEALLGGDVRDGRDGSVSRVLGGQLLSDRVDRNDEAHDDQDRGDDQDRSGKNGGSLDDQVNAEDRQEDQQGDDDEVADDIGQVDQALDDAAGAVNAGSDRREDDDDVKDLEEDLHPRLRIQGTVGVLVVVETAELGKLHHDVHDDSQDAHGQQREDRRGPAILDKVVHDLVAGRKAGAHVGAEPDRRHGEGGCPAALELFVIHFLPLSFFLFFCFSLFYFNPASCSPTNRDRARNPHPCVNL